jgi:hypothetical protein
MLYLWLGAKRLTTAHQPAKLSNPGKGMEKLLNHRNNLFMLVKSTEAITAGSVIKIAKKRADKLTAMTGKTVLPSITAQTEAQEEADRLNVINQLVIGAG